MNIVILRTGTSNFGKIGSYNVQEVGLAKALIKLGYSVDVLYLNRKTDKIITDKVYDFVHYLPHIKIGIHGVFKLSILDSFAPDRVILFSDNQLWSKNVIMWCKKRNIQCVHYFGAVLSNTNKWINKTYTRLILFRNRKSYKYSINVAKTNCVKTEMERCGIHCDSVINIGLDDSLLEQERNLSLKIRNELKIPTDEISLLFVGRFANDKRPLAACDVLKEMLSQGIKCQLIMIGRGYMQDEILKRINELGLEHYIKIIPLVPYSDMYKYFVASDCCINMSHVEIFGMTILESLFYGLPMVAHTAPGPNEIIIDGFSGYLCDSDDPKIWVETIKKAIENRKIISVNAHNEITNRFTWDIIAHQFI